MSRSQSTNAAGSRQNSSQARLRTVWTGSAVVGARSPPSPCGQNRPSARGAPARGAKHWHALSSGPGARAPSGLGVSGTPASSPRAWWASRGVTRRDPVRVSAPTVRPSPEARGAPPRPAPAAKTGHTARHSVDRCEYPLRVEDGARRGKEVFMQSRCRDPGSSFRRPRSMWGYASCRHHRPPPRRDRNIGG